MYKAALLLCFIAFIYIISGFFKTILDLVGLPNIIPVTRDLILFSLSFISIYRSNIFKEKYFFIPILFVLLILVLNILIAVFDSRIYAGFYYSRIYLIPLFFSVASFGLIIPLSRDEIFRLVRFIYICGALLIFSAVAIFLAVEYDPFLKVYLMSGMGGMVGMQGLGGVSGDQIKLATAWYIAGSSWMRMGIPATSPNSLGLITALFVLFLLIIQFSGRAKEVGGKYFKFVLCISISVLLLTFSRSSWLACLTGLFLVAFSFRDNLFHRSYLRPMAIAGFIFSAAFILVITLIAIDIYNDGSVGIWINLGLTGKDPSIIGHLDSFVEAWYLLDQYIYIGFPRGSVGPKAILFGGRIFNAENSIIGIFFDMGIPIGLALIVAIGLILRGLWQDHFQLSILIPFLVAAQFLPYSFESDVIVFFLMIYVVTGRLMSFPTKSNSAADEIDKSTSKINY